MFGELIKHIYIYLSKIYYKFQSLKQIIRKNTGDREFDSWDEISTIEEHMKLSLQLTLIGKQIMANHDNTVMIIYNNIIIIIII